MRAITKIWDFTSQSTSLMSVEFLVDNIVRRYLHLISLGAGKRFEVSQEQFFSERIFDKLNEIISLYQPGYIYAENIRIFWHACWEVGLLSQWGRTNLAVEVGRQAESARYQAVARLVEIIPGMALAESCRRQSADRRYQTDEKAEGIEAYINSLVNLRARTRVVRIDGGYRREAYPHVTVDAFYQAIDAFRAMVKRARGPFEHCLGYVICAEQGVSREWHFHALFVYDASEVASDYHRGQLAGQAWIECTDGYGTFYNCNGRQEAYEARGVNGLGLVARGDQDKVDRLLLAAGYLADSEKDDQYLRMRPPGSRTFWKGRMRVHSGLGRPSFRSEQDTDMFL